MRHALSAVALSVILALPGLTAPAAAASAPTPASGAAAKQARPPQSKDQETEKDKKGGMDADTWSGLAWRPIGPAVTEGRITDIAVDPRDTAVRYVTAASGGVWKTTNAGASWTPIFDHEGSYSIGCITLDPSNPDVVWVGTGENNSQRSVGFGDGVYKSEDGGKSWTDMGLKASEHIGRIVVDPHDSNVVYVAAQGPLWNPGGDRGLYKTTDGGKTWKAVLTISENTGVNDVVMDPRDPNLLYASSYQRRRHVWTLIDGGPESAIYRSTDAGATWKKLESGLPKEDKGRIGLAIAPSAPDTVYAIVESTRKAGGVFRSTNRGASWEKRGDYMTTSPQYYNEIWVDPKNSDRVYAEDTFFKVSDDGGKSFHNLGERWKHVDNHALWIDPADDEHYLVGCDGGLYETFDRAKSWTFRANLNITQFYRVALDNSRPFYYVYGGTQDNESMGGPSRTLNMNGIANSDWFVTQGGDGFVSAVDPVDPNIVYAEAQNGALVRFDRKSGEQLYIQPQEGKGEPALRWNWDSPLLISPHSHTRLYFAANKLFRSDDRGQSWRAISPDLTRQLDRNQLKVMGKVWGVDAVAKNASTSFYGNIVSLTESPKQDGLIYVGTDDGLVQVTENGGTSWRKIERFPGIPENAYVSALKAGKNAADTVYAAFDNHKMGDYKPYLLRSADRGKTWTSIVGDLPARGTVYGFAEDPVDPQLLFAGTEFGAFFTADGGKHWVQLKGGLPTIPVREIAIQERENDLVIATFGRGFYVLDDYTPLRRATPATLDQKVAVFPVKTALAYMEQSPLGLPGKAFMGESYFLAPNPPFGATFTYYLKDSIKTLKKERWESEKKLEKEGKVPPYPSLAELRAEEQEEEPSIVLTVADAEGGVVRRLTGPVSAGVHRVAWDLRFPDSEPTDLKPRPTDNPFEQPPTGPMAVPGTYTVSLAERVGGKLTPIGDKVSFAVEPLGLGTLAAPDKAALLAFERKTARLQRAVLGASDAAKEAMDAIQHIKKAVLDTPGADPALGDQARALESRLRDIQLALQGDRVAMARNEPTPPSIIGRVQTIVGTQWTSTSAPTQSSLDAYQIAGEEFATELEKLRVLIGQDLKQLNDKLESVGAPWTPGRLPVWRME